MRKFRSAYAREVLGLLASDLKDADELIAFQVDLVHALPRFGVVSRRTTESPLRLTIGADTHIIYEIQAAPRGTYETASGFRCIGAFNLEPPRPLPIISRYGQIPAAI